MNTISIVDGPRRASTPAPPLIPADPAAVLAKAALLDLEATLHQDEGRTGHADRLSHRALEMRCRALGVPA